MLHFHGFFYRNKVKSLLFATMQLISQLKYLQALHQNLVWLLLASEGFWQVEMKSPTVMIWWGVLLRFLPFTQSRCFSYTIFSSEVSPFISGPRFKLDYVASRSNKSIGFAVQERKARKFPQMTTFLAWIRSATVQRLEEQFFPRSVWKVLDLLNAYTRSPSATLVSPIFIKNFYRSYFLFGKKIFRSNSQQWICRLLDKTKIGAENFCFVNISESCRKIRLIWHSFWKKFFFLPKRESF